MEQQKAFDRSKQLLTSSQLLVHFNPDLEIILVCDASDYGIDAVLSHCMPSGCEKPIGFVSRTLTKVEKNYQQIEKEGLRSLYLWYEMLSLILIWPQVCPSDRSLTLNNPV